MYTQHTWVDRLCEQYDNNVTCVDPIVTSTNLQTDIYLMGDW